MKYSKRIVALMFLTVFAYVGLGVYASLRQTPLDSTLTMCFFGFMGVEGGALAWIKTTETKKDKGGTNTKGDDDNVE